MRYGLAVPIDVVCVQDIRFASRGIAPSSRAEQGRVFHLRRVLVSYDRKHPGRILRLVYIYALDRSFGDGAVDKRGVGEILKRILSRKRCFAGNFFTSIQAIERLADEPVGFAEVIAVAIWDKVDDSFGDFGEDTHQAAPFGDNSFRTLTMVRLANSILKPLYANGFADSSSSAAAW